MIEEKIPAQGIKMVNTNFKCTIQAGELSCSVVKEQDKLNVCIDNNMTAELAIQPDGTLTQISGNEMPHSAIEYIKKRVLG